MSNNGRYQRNQGPTRITVVMPAWKGPEQASAEPRVASSHPRTTCNQTELRPQEKKTAKMKPKPSAPTSYISKASCVTTTSNNPSTVRHRDNHAISGEVSCAKKSMSRCGTTTSAKEPSNSDRSQKQGHQSHSHRRQAHDVSHAESLKSPSVTEAGCGSSTCTHSHRHGQRSHGSQQQSQHSSTRSSSDNAVRSTDANFGKSPSRTTERKVSVHTRTPLQSLNTWSQAESKVPPSNPKPTLKEPQDSSLQADDRAVEKGPCQGSSLQKDKAVEKRPCQGSTQHVNNRAVQKRPSQGSSGQKDKKAVEKGSCQGLSLQKDEAVEKRPCQGSTQHTDKRAVQKRPSHSLSQHRDERAVEKGPCQGSSQLTDNRGVEKRSCQGSSLQNDKKAVEKGPCQGSTQHTDKKAVQKKPRQSSSLHTDERAVEKGPCQGSSRHKDREAIEKGHSLSSTQHTGKRAVLKRPSQGSSQHMDNRAVEKGPSQGSSQYKDSRAVEKGPSQGSSQHKDSRAVEKGPSHGSSQHKDSRAVEKGPSHGSSQHKDSRAVEKVPSHVSSQHKDSRAVEKGPSHGSSQHTENRAVEKGPSHGSSQHKDSRAVEKGLSHGSSQHKDNRAVLKRSSQGSSPHTDNRAVEKGLSKGSSRHKDKKAVEKGASQGSIQHADNRAVEKGPSQGSSQHTDNTSVEKGPCHGSSQHKDKKAVEKGPSRGSSLHRDKKAVEKGASQISAQHTDKRAVQKRTSEGSSLHIDQKVVEKGPNHSSSLHRDKKTVEKGPSRGSSLHRDKKAVEKRPSQGSSPHSDNRAAQKGSCKGSSQHTDGAVEKETSSQGPPIHTDRVAQKGPSQGTVLKKEKRSAQKRPYQGLVLDTDNDAAKKRSNLESTLDKSKGAAQKGSRQESVLNKDNTNDRAAQKGPGQGSVQDKDNTAAQKRPIQGSVLNKGNTNDRAAQKRFSQGSVLDKDKGAAQKGPSQGSVLDKDKGAAQKGPSEEAVLDKDNKAAQKGPSQASDQNKDKGAVQKGPSEQAVLDKDKGAAQKGPSEEAVLDKDNKATQKGPSQRSVKDQDNKAAQKGPSQGSQQDKINVSAQKGPCQGSAQDKGPCQELSLPTSNRVTQKEPRQESIIDRAYRDTQKGPCQGLLPDTLCYGDPPKEPHQGSSLFTSNKFALKGPFQRPPHGTDNRTALKGPCQGSLPGRDNRDAQKGPCQGAPLLTNSEPPLQGPCRGPSLHRDGRPAQQGPPQGSPQHSDIIPTQKGPDQESPLYTENRIAQQGPCQGSSHHLDIMPTQKGPDQGSPLYTDSRIAQQGPHQGSSQHSDVMLSQNGPDQGSPLYAENTTQQGPHQGSSQHSDIIPGQEGPDQGSPLYTKNRTVQQGPHQGSSQHSDTVPSQKGPDQGHMIYPENRTAQKGPGKGFLHYSSNSRTAQQGSNQESPLNTDSRAAQRGPFQGSALHTNNRPVQKGPYQGSSLLKDNRIGQNGSCQGPQLHTDCKPAQQGPCQGVSLHTDSRPAQQGPCQGSSQHPATNPNGPNPGPKVDTQIRLPQASAVQRLPPAQSSWRVPPKAEPQPRLLAPSPHHKPFSYRSPLLPFNKMPPSSARPRAVLHPYRGASQTVANPRPALLPEKGVTPLGPRHRPPRPSDNRAAQPGSSQHRAQGVPATQAGPHLKAAPSSDGEVSQAPVVSCADSSCHPPPPPQLTERVSPAVSIFRPLLQRRKVLQACPNPRPPLHSGQRMSQPGSGNLPPQSMSVCQGGRCPGLFVPLDIATSRSGPSCVPLPCPPDNPVSVLSNNRPPRPLWYHRAVPNPYPRLPPPCHARPPVPSLLPPGPIFRPLPLPHTSVPLSELVRRPPPPLPNRPRVPGPLGPVFRPPLRLHGRLPLPYPPPRLPPLPHTHLPLPSPGNKPPAVSRPNGDSPDHIVLQPLSVSAGKMRSTESWRKCPVSDGCNFPANPFMGLSIKGNWCTVPKELGHGDKDERTYIQLEPSLKMMFSFDVENPIKWTISPDQRASYSFDGSYISDSLSTRTDKSDTDSSARDTPMSWNMSSHLKQLPSSSCTSMCFCHKFNAPFYLRDEQESNVASDSVSSKDGLWEAESVENQDGVGNSARQGCRPYRTVSGCDNMRETGFQCHCPGCSPADHIRRVGWKRAREGSPLSDPDLDWEERLWRTAAKRLRLNVEELKPQTGNEASESTAKEDDTPSWTRSSPADLYFTRTEQGTLEATQKMKDLEDTFEEQLVKRAEKAQSSQSTSGEPVLPTPHPCTHSHHHNHRHHHHHRRRRRRSSCSSDSSSSESDSEEGGVCNSWMEEMNRKRKHPNSLHSELWYNDPGEMNNGPLCRCSVKARKTGLRHNVFPGEEVIEPCDPASNNLKRLYHYRITMSPSTNFLTNSPTVIKFDGHEFIFEGFSLFTHEKLDNVPLCKVIRFHIEYTIHFIEEQVPENFTIRSLDLVTQFLFKEILELVDLDWIGPSEGCQLFHIMPRFARLLPENGKEILSMNEVLKFLLRSSRPLVGETDLPVIQNLDKDEWQSWVEKVCGMIVTYPGKKPGSIRVDQLDRTQLLDGEKAPPILVHFGIRPAQLSYAGDPTYQKAWKHYIKFKHLLNSKPKVSREDKLRLKLKEAQLQDLQRKSSMKREVTVELSSQGFLRTGLKSDICQHALLLPVLISHIRFHSCLAMLEDHLQYSFQDRSLLQLALTHTSFRCNYGTNPAHARNSLTNCGLRQVEYGDRRIYYQNTRKRGINILVDIMSRMGRKEETPSDIPHNERLEFLGDAVIEFLSSVHLFFMFPWLEEGGLSTYRTAIVQNQHLAILAENLRLQDFMLFVHGPDLCHESDLRHAMANCFEALMGALFLDGGLDVVDQVFARTLFEDSHTCFKTWLQLPLHPLQEDEPGGDRHWVESSPALQKLISFEERTGITFGHIRLLAKAFTHRNVGYNILTMGHNQRLEFLGDTVLQLISSEYLYKHFPEHHEGHLSLLRSSLVNSRTQAIVCDDLGMLDFVIYNNAGTDKFDMKTKQKADLLEAVLGALYVDSGMEFCKIFCDVCFFPRLRDFILNQDWNDPKSQLQQCCLTLRKMGAGEPDIPVYKVIESLGPSNTRKYIVAVYFRGERMATGTGHSIQQAEMSAATNALKMRPELFPILQHQRRFLRRRYQNIDWNDKPTPFHNRYSSNNNNSSYNNSSNSYNNSSNNNSSSYSNYKSNYNSSSANYSNYSANYNNYNSSSTNYNNYSSSSTNYNNYSIDSYSSNNNINNAAASPAHSSSPSSASSVSSLPIRQA